MRTAAPRSHHLLVALLAPLVALCGASAPAGTLPPGEDQASLAAFLLVFVAAGALGLLAAMAFALAAMVRRRRGPAPLARLLLAGSLGDMQCAHPHRWEAER
jgi:hypothetical protein